MNAAPTVLDLFAGACGGWSLGLHRVGYRTVAACEIDPWRRSAFLSNFPDVEMWDDVRAVSARSLRDRLGCLPRVVVGSPPCQDASAANPGGLGIDGERTGLFFEAIRIVREVAPLWCAFENVPGLRAKGVERVLSGLEEAGYAVWPLVVGAVHAGAPHKRNRVWIVAANTDEWRDGPRQARREGPGRFELGAGTGGRVATDAAEDRPERGLRLERADRRGTREGEAGKPWPAPEPDGPRRGSREPVERRGEDPGDDGREMLAAWHGWNGGWAARAGRVDDGLPRGMARQSLAAYGDAVVPQITEAIGRAMLSLTENLS